MSLVCLTFVQHTLVFSFRSALWYVARTKVSQEWYIILSATKYFNLVLQVISKKIYLYSERRLYQHLLLQEQFNYLTRHNEEELVQREIQQAIARQMAEQCYFQASFDTHRKPKSILLSQLFLQLATGQGFGAYVDYPGR